MTARLAAIMTAAVFLGGCASKSQTQIQLRDADDQTLLVGEHIGRPGSLHLAHHWQMTDTNGSAWVRAPRNFDDLDIVVGATDRRIEARGTLHAGSTQWVALTAEPNAPRRIEACIVSGEGAPPARVATEPQPPHD